jgi:hypothetical protein
MAVAAKHKHTADSGRAWYHQVVGKQEGLAAAPAVQQQTEHAQRRHGCGVDKLNNIYSSLGCMRLAHHAVMDK